MSPTGVEIIGRSASNDPKLKPVRIPKSVKTVDQAAFIRCKSLSERLTEEGMKGAIGDDGLARPLSQSPRLQSLSGAAMT